MNRPDPTLGKTSQGTVLPAQNGDQTSGGDKYGIEAIDFSDLPDADWAAEMDGEAPISAGIAPEDRSKGSVLGTLLGIGLAIFTKALGRLRPTSRVRTNT